MGSLLCGEGPRDVIIGCSVTRDFKKEIDDFENEEINTSFPVALCNASTGWDSSVYSCGVGIIDEHHCALFQIATNLQFISDRYIDNAHRPNAMTEDVARKRVTEILQYLDRYINLHFITEEMLFKEHLGAQSSKVDVQRQAHRQFTEYITQVLNGNFDNALRITIIHVLGYVRKLIKHISEHEQPEIRRFAYGLTLDYDGHLVYLEVAYVVTLNRNITSIADEKSKSEWNPFKFGTSVDILDQQLTDIFQLLANAESLSISETFVKNASTTEDTSESTNNVNVLLRHFEAHLIEHFQLCEELSTEYGVNNFDWSRLKNSHFLITLQVKEKRKLYRKSSASKIISELRNLFFNWCSESSNQLDFTALLGGRIVDNNGHLM